MKPLTTKQRSTSMLFLAGVFILIAPIISLYSIGYRLDGDFSLQKTGGIFVHSDVANSALFVDEEFFKTSGIFFRNILVQDLTPNKEYKIEVHKEGYQSWVKKIFVYPNIVSEGRAILMPNEFKQREIFKYLDSENIATSTPLSKSQTLPTNPEYISIEKLFASSTDTVLKKEVATSTITATATPQSQKSNLQIFFEKLDIPNFEKLPNLKVVGKEVSWIKDGNIHLYWTGDLSSIPYYYCRGDSRECVKNIILDWDDEIKKFEYLPGRSDIWVVLVETGIYAVEVDGRTDRNIQRIVEDKNINFILTQNDRLIIKKDSRYFEINL